MKCVVDSCFIEGDVCGLEGALLSCGWFVNERAGRRCNMCWIYDSLIVVIVPRMLLCVYIDSFRNLTPPTRYLLQWIHSIWVWYLIKSLWKSKTKTLQRSSLFPVSFLSLITQQLWLKTVHLEMRARSPHLSSFYSLKMIGYCKVPMVPAWQESSVAVTEVTKVLEQSAQAPTSPVCWEYNHSTVLPCCCRLLALRSHYTAACLLECFISIGWILLFL